MAAENELDPFERAYVLGLGRFIDALRETKPENEVAFKAALRFGLRHFGLAATELAQRVDHSKGTISKWLNSDCTPSLSTREVAIGWMLVKATEQLIKYDKR